MRTLILLFLLTMGSYDVYASDVTVYTLSETSRYVLVVPHFQRIFIQLRSWEDDTLLDEVVLGSKYMQATHEDRDVILDTQKELVVKRRYGGTGFTETILEILAFIDDRIVNIGSFIIDHGSIGPGNGGSIKIEGRIRFTAINKLEYEFQKEIEENGKRSVISEREKYIFDTKLKKFVKKTPDH